MFALEMLQPNVQLSFFKRFDKITFFKNCKSILCLSPSRITIIMSSDSPPPGPDRIEPYPMFGMAQNDPLHILQFFTVISKGTCS